MSWTKKPAEELYPLDVVVDIAVDAMRKVGHRVSGGKRHLLFMRANQLEYAADARCDWTYDNVHEKYDTACGNVFFFSEGSPEDNCFSFCPYCGKRIES